MGDFGQFSLAPRWFFHRRKSRPGYPLLFLDLSTAVLAIPFFPPPDRTAILDPASAKPGSSRVLCHDMTYPKIPLAGVIGHPVAHSLSPRLHGHWLRRYGITGHYVPLDIAKSDLARVLAVMPRMGFVGCNVTIPHKQAALGLADQATDRARRIGAANTLTFGPDGRIHADNTDGHGFMANLRDGAPDIVLPGATVAVLGAGGAARAVLVALLGAGVGSILLSNRTMARAEALRDEFGARIATVPWEDAGETIARALVVVNTTSLGMTGQDALSVPLDMLRPGQVVSDLVYNPLETSLLQAARRAGAVAVDGLGMLLHQAVPGFERWFGRRPEVDAETRMALLS